MSAPTPTPSIFQLAAYALELSQAILEAGGEITPAVDALLVVNEKALAEKADGYAAVLDRMEAEENLWRQRREECDRMVQAYKSVQTRLKDRMKEALVAMDRKEVRGEMERFTIRPSKGSLVIANDLASEYYMAVTEVVPDKERIRADLEAGKTIQGAKIQPGWTLSRYANKKGKDGG